jgi:hypothetical protein
MLHLNTRGDLVSCLLDASFRGRQLAATVPCG